MSTTPHTIEPPATRPVSRRESLFRVAGFAFATAVVFLTFPLAWLKAYTDWRFDGRVYQLDSLFLLLMMVLVSWSMWRWPLRIPRSTVALVGLAGLAVWVALSIIISRRLTSLLLPDWRLLVLGAATSLWLYWFWLAFLVPASLRVRGLVLALLIALVPLNTWLVRSDGRDGDMRLMLSWRYARSGRAASAAATTRSEGTTAPSMDSGEFAEFRGSPRRDGALEGIRLETDWAARPPRERWRIPVGLGWSGFAVSDGKAVTHEQRGEQESVVCYDLATGHEIWNRAHAAAFRSTIAGDGPRATPTIAGDRVLTLGATGMLHCLDLDTGHLLWSVQTLEDNGAENLVHGACGSPLVVGDLVIVSPGGPQEHSLAAYRLADGSRAWHAGSDAGGYASPQLSTVAGNEQVLILNAPGVSAHDPATGRVLWTHPWQNEQQVSVSQPLVVASDPTRILISSGYGKGCTLVEISPRDDGTCESRELWKSRNLKTKFTCAVVHDGFAYGLDDGILNCVDLQDGSKRWKSGRYGHGQVLLVNDVLLVQTESGEVVLVAADPAEQRELATLPALSGRTWNHPTLAGRLLIVRNDREAVCYELPLAE
ncbi:MAG: PQQ-like beta-propeller repeat protein [Pirellulales bacterium]|nr:PQQ-like beta-propeller repeat protein [Pirellulales bacterium]